MPSRLHQGHRHGRETLADEVRCLDLERMVSEVEAFTQALELGLIDADDF